MWSRIGPSVLFFLSSIYVCVHTASFYGESYIRVPFQQASRSTEVKLHFKTHRPHGLLLLASGTTDYFAIELKSGIIEVRVNLGSGEATFHSTPGLRLDDLQWHSIHINQSYKTFHLNVDNVMISSIKTPGSLQELNIEYGIFLGGTGTFTDVFHGNFKNFRGCQKNVLFNQYDILSLAKQLNNPLNTFEIYWDCDDQFDAGSEQPISFKTETSFVAFPHFHIRSQGTFSCDLITHSQTALILFNSGRHESVHDFIALEILNGRLKLSVNKGNGVKSVMSDEIINDGRWHQVDIFLSASVMELKVDSKPKQTHFSLGDNAFFNLAGHLFLGGVSVRARAHALKRGLKSLQGKKSMKGSMLGCIQNVVINKRVYGFREIQVSRTVDPHCHGQFPCASDPCVDGAVCSEVNKVEFKCICDEPVCTKENFTSTGFSTKDHTNVLAIEGLKLEEGAQTVITTETIDVIFDYKAYRTRESSIQFKVKVPPQYGRIDIDVRRRKHSDRFTLLDLMGQKVFYVHDGTDTTSDDVTFEMTINPQDPSLPEKYHGVFDFVVPIVIIPYDDPPKLELPSGSAIKIAHRARLKITKQILNVHDPDTNPADLQFSVTYQPEHGYIAKGDKVGQSISTFTQEDVNNGQVWFIHKRGSTIHLEIEVMDSSSKSDRINLQIIAVNLQLEMTKITGIKVYHGTSTVISPNNLTAMTNVPAQRLDIRYRISKQPKYGKVERRKHEDDSWITVDSFSQRHIDNGRLRYSHTHFNKYPNKDAFSFIVMAKDIALEENTLDIIFLPVSLKVETNSKLTLKHVSYSALSPQNLNVNANTNAVDAKRIVYSILRLPSHGGFYIMKSSVNDISDFDQSRPLKAKANFTQSDINDGTLFYKVHRPSFSIIEDFVDLKISFVGSRGIMSRLLIKYLPEHSSVRFLNNGLKDVIEGGKKVIEKDDLSLEVDNYKNSQFTVMSPPAHGSLKLIDPRSSSVLEEDVTEFTNTDIRDGKLVYQHDDSENTADSFTFTAAPMLVSDSDSSELQEYSGTFLISMLMRNDNPPAILINRVFQVVKNKKRPITIRDLEFMDPDVDFDTDKLKYSRRGIPNGDIIDAKSSKSVYEFTQKDLVDENLLFVHKGADHERAAMWVTDGQFVKPFLFEIQASDPYIKIVNNTGIKVKQGGHTEISTHNISVDTNVNTKSSSVNFVMTEEPLNGHLRIRGKQVTEFTLEDVSNEVIRYWHDGSNNMEDKFKFAVIVDGAQTKGIFPIVVFRESELHPPQVVHNKLLELPEGSRAEITSSHLQVTHPSTPSKDIIFTVTTLPTGGVLRVGSKELAGDATPTFTQKDIDQGHVAYSQSATDVLSDQFIFDVSNGHQSLLNLQFYIEVVPTYLPLVVKNISVVEGGQVSLTKEVLSLKGRHFKNKRVTFEITNNPFHGWFESSAKKGVRVLVFTSDDIATTNRIFYHHNGDESLTDQFSVTAVLDDQTKRSRPQNVHVQVRPVNDQPPRVVINAGLSVWKGSITELTNQSLLAEDADSSPSEITFRVSSPTSGHIAFLDNTFRAINSFTQKQVNAGAVVFVHTGEGDGQFNLQASDGTNNDILRLFKITANPLVLTLRNNRQLKVFPNTLQPILPGNLLAVTSDQNLTKPIVYTLERKPRKGRIVTLMEGQPLEITSFNQEEVSEGRIFYQHESYIPTWSVSDSFFFEVSTAYAEPLKDEMLDVDISYGNINQGNMGSLVRVMAASVSEGGEVSLTRENLDISELQHRLQQYGRGVTVQYLMMGVPRHGKIQQDGFTMQANDSFSQSRVNSGMIKYLHDDSDTTEDAFKFALKIQQPTGEAHISFIANITIIVEPINDEKFTLLTKNPSLRVIQGRTANITSLELKTTDPDTTPDGIIYSIVTGPDIGKLVFREYPDVTVKRFTQQDINTGRLLFVHDGTRNSGEFYFKVSDGTFRPYYKIFNIYVIPLTVEISVNMPVELTQSKSSVYITNKSLNISTNSERENIWYNITRDPEFGQIYYEESPVRHFAQTDIDNELLLYIQTDMTAGSDYFICDLYAKGIQVLATAQRINITVKPLVRQRSLHAPVGSYSAITKYTLDATELAGITRDNPVYEITEKPKHGKIMKINRGRRAVDANAVLTEVSAFTHEDVVYTKVQYKSDLPQSNAMQDSFRYVLKANGVQPAAGMLVISLQPPEDDLSSLPPVFVPLSSTPKRTDATKSMDRDGFQEKTTASVLGPDVNKSTADSSMTSDYIIIAVVIGVVVVVVLILVIVVILLKRRRRQNIVQEELKTRTKPRPFISGPLQLEQPHVLIEPQFEGEDNAGKNTYCNIPVINISPGGGDTLESDALVSSAPRSPDLSRQEVSKVVPSCKVTPLVEISEAPSEMTSIQAPESAKSNTSADVFDFDWNEMDPDLLQHCRTTTPVLRKNQYWV
ncbi:chondroitin sulfate proteoglycan 4-like [Gigantopelta aegis]|uniref:chondroitin sulfate proteoglycan 4-like n=1 Tax=Gigantopelta aegis TaxID=1735272 RepID=UPI001B889817|nr:chondroitin sulfate proteoglycan 4-like [Gigantopelta aegis]